MIFIDPIIENNLKILVLFEDMKVQLGTQNIIMYA